MRLACALPGDNAGLDLCRPRSYGAGGALEYQWRTHVAYDNTASPLGQHADERSSYVALHMMLSRVW